MVRTGNARVEAVAYGQLLFRLGAPQDVSGRVAAAGPRDTSGVPRGAVGVTAPPDGVFSGRPSPAAPPFVEIGSRVRAGQPVGLVEVMKTFNQIVYGGPGQPEQAEVLEIRCEDGEEVCAGQLLVVLR